MKAKDKKIKVTLKNIIYLSIALIVLIQLFVFYNYYFVKNESYARETNADVEDVQISKAKKIDIDKFIENTVDDTTKEEYVVNEEVLEYLTKYMTNSSLPKGTVQVVQEGRQGLQEITKKRVYQNGEMVSEEQVGAKVTKASVNKIVEIGGASWSSNYKVKVGDTVYVTSDRLGVMVEPSETSQKIATLSRGDTLNVQEILNGWYRVKGESTRGYVKIENTTYINPNQENNGDGSSNETSQSKQSLISKLSFNMALNKPSGLTLEQFKKILKDDKDKNNIFSQNAEYFYYIEKQYNINGVFVAAIGIHESAWGTSKIARDKCNLFGYGAYDSNPYNGAYSFSDYSESIDLIARVLVKYYLNPKGTSIYGGETAQGTYYNGPTLSGVNTKYATDKNWANGVYTHMTYLYNKL